MPSIMRVWVFTHSHVTAPFLDSSAKLLKDVFFVLWIRALLGNVTSSLGVQVVVPYEIMVQMLCIRTSVCWIWLPSGLCHFLPIICVISNRLHLSW
jgi:hypothetical protein